MGSLPRLQGFNSKLVRLKGRQPRIYHLQWYSFQFQTGAIKRLRNCKAVHTTRTGFNSKLVRLKEAQRAREPIPSAKFQFQTGAIKSKKVFFSFGVFWRVFQFQTGAIKSGGCQPRLPSVDGFNSKLVRLKAECAHRNGNPRMRFNSKLVRLKVRRLAFRIAALGRVSIPNWCD